MSKRSVYKASYRDNLEDDTTTTSSPNGQDVDPNATDEQSLSPEEKSWKKRYGDLRSYNTQLTERVSNLENQLRAAQKQDIKMPSTKEEVEAFARTYPDVFRHIRSIALMELVQEREVIAQETASVKEDLERVKRERGLAKIKEVHKDFDEINLSEAFHEWASRQPTQIQNWIYEDNDPDLCIRALDLYKLEKKAKAPTRRQNTDVLVRTSSPVDIDGDVGGKKIWKQSEIQRMHPKYFEQHEEEIELARREGRIDPNA